MILSRKITLKPKTWWNESWLNSSSFLNSIFHLYIHFFIFRNLICLRDILLMTDSLFSIFNLLKFSTWSLYLFSCVSRSKLQISLCSLQLLRFHHAAEWSFDWPIIITFIYQSSIYTSFVGLNISSFSSFTLLVLRSISIFIQSHFLIYFLVHVTCLRKRRTVEYFYLLKGVTYFRDNKCSYSFP